MVNGNRHSVDVNESLVVSKAIDIMVILWEDRVKELNVVLF